MIKFFKIARTSNAPSYFRIFGKYERVTKKKKLARLIGWIMDNLFVAHSQN